MRWHGIASAVGWFVAHKSQRGNILLNGEDERTHTMQHTQTLARILGQQSVLAKYADKQRNERPGLSFSFHFFFLPRLYSLLFCCRHVAYELQLIESITQP